MAYFVGIDPGVTGGIAILDAAGGFIAAHRWSAKAPESLYNILVSIRGEIDNYIYLELVQTFPQKDSGFQQRNQGLLVNLGIWQGFCLAAGVPFELISPLTWQAAHGLTSWAKKQADGIACHSPLSLARSLWPAAPLPCQVDDGKAAALLLADLARRDRFAGIDRRALRLVRETKEKARRKKLKAQKALAAPGLNTPIFSPGPPPRPYAPRPLPSGHALPPAPGQRPQVAPKVYLTIGPDGIREL